MNTSNAVIYIVEDDASFRKSVVRLIRTAGFKTETFDSANDFLENAAIRYPGCLLLDVRLPDIDGLRLHRLLQRHGCRLPVIFMTGHGSIPMGVNAMKDGAIDFLPKPFKTDVLLSAVHDAIQRNRNDMQKVREQERINARFDTLTPREREVFRWVITGKRNKQIAHELEISEKTIKVHRSRVMVKMQASSLPELVRMAQKVYFSPAD